MDSHMVSFHPQGACAKATYSPYTFSYWSWKAYMPYSRELKSMGVLGVFLFVRRPLEFLISYLQMTAY